MDASIVILRVILHRLICNLNFHENELTAPSTRRGFILSLFYHKKLRILYLQTLTYNSTMSQPHIYTKDDIAKIGNTLVFFAERINDLSKTKLLKLVYLLEETTIRKCSRPFLNLDFEIWKLGPVVKDLFFDFSSTEQYIFKDYVSAHLEEEGRVYISPVTHFDDDEFSDIELSILDDVVKQFGHLSAKELVELTHSAHSPWTITAKQQGVLDDLLNNRVYTTDLKIDFNSLLDEDGRDAYAQHLEYLQASRSLK